jgi:hypothetical protein
MLGSVARNPTYLLTTEDYLADASGIDIIKGV